MGKYDDRPYPVGKGKPPREHRFKTGQSGNPRGPRRKKKVATASIAELAREAVSETVNVSTGGKQRKLSKMEVMVAALANDAITGTPLERSRAIKQLMEIGAFGTNGVAEEVFEPNTEQVQNIVRELQIEYDREREADYMPLELGKISATP